MSSSLIQPKLRISQPDDLYEQEADRVAGEVMRMPVEEPIPVSQAPVLVQRKGSGCEEQWESDIDGFSRTIARHYMYHINPSWAGPGMKDVDCIIGSVEGGWRCYVTFADGTRVGVDLLKIPYYVRAQQVEPAWGPTCESDYYCPTPGDIRFFQWKCVDEHLVGQSKGKEGPGPGSDQAIVRRKCESCESGRKTCPECAEEEEKTVHRKAADVSPRRSDPGRRGPETGGVNAGPSIHDSIRNISGGGDPLPASVRNFFEPRFGHDFSQVRIHSGRHAGEVARSVNALAFAVGDHIVFGRDQYQPGTAAGRKLLAHELTHIVQLGGTAYGSADTSTIHRQREEQSLLISSAPEFPDCSPYQRFRIDYQLARARTMTQNGIAALTDEIDRSTGPGAGIITIAGSALERYFHTQDPRHIRTIRARMERILAQLERSPRNWRCRTTAGCRSICEPSSNPPLACAGPTGSVSVCPPHFEDPDTAGSLTLIHEAGHQAGLGLRTPAGHRTDIYEFEPRFAGLTTTQAMNTPDAYAAFIRDNIYGGQLRRRSVWTPRDFMIIGDISEPSFSSSWVGRLAPGEISRFPPGTVIENRFSGLFVFDAWTGGSGRTRPELLRSPEVSLRIVIRRSGSASVRGGRPRESVLFDRAGRAAPNAAGRMNPPGTTNGFEVDFPFDTEDRGVLHITAEIRDEDTNTVLTYNDRIPVRPTGGPVGGAPPGPP